MIRGSQIAYMQMPSSKAKDLRLFCQKIYFTQSRRGLILVPYVALLVRYLHVLVVEGLGAIIQCGRRVSFFFFFFTLLHNRVGVQNRNRSMPHIYNFFNNLSQNRLSSMQLISTSTQKIQVSLTKLITKNPISFIMIRI